ncbi:hypothetical protein [Halobaculum roseum]|uniref:Uncharacterized protein n=1 Tax=Halobaculum roseum TaxID=2175149 RepID=A0ABD5MIW4_9EURY|nr:hypothetical protein [Halobaculum roseum]QZY04219.1 hypothetical protein K6T36_16015 [Halobaculum roseum]
MLELDDYPEGTEQLLEAYLDKVPSLTGEEFETAEDYRSACPSKLNLELATELDYEQVSYRMGELASDGIFGVHYEEIGRGSPRIHYYPKEPLRVYVKTQTLMKDLFGEIPTEVRTHHLETVTTELGRLRRDVRTLTIKAGFPPESTGHGFTDEDRDEVELRWE